MAGTQLNQIDQHSTLQRAVSRAVILGPKGCLVLHKYRVDRGDYYGLPGGAKAPSESLTEALQREAWEEIGCQLQDPVLIGVADYRRRTSAGQLCDHIEHLFAATVPDDYEPHNGSTPDRYQKSVRWISLADVSQALFSPAFLRDTIQQHAANPSAFMGYIGAFSDTPADTATGDIAGDGLEKRLGDASL